MDASVIPKIGIIEKKNDNFFKNLTVMPFYTEYSLNK